MLAVRQFNRCARPSADELPRVALEIDDGGALARRPRTGGAVILPLEGRRHTSPCAQRRPPYPPPWSAARRKQSWPGARQDKRRSRGFHRHRFSPGELVILNGAHRDIRSYCADVTVGCIKKTRGM